MVPDLCRKCASYSSKIQSKSKICYFQTLKIKIENKCLFRTHAGNYDVSPGLEANGYRSLLSMLESLLLGIIQLLRTIQTSREYTFFRINEHLDKLEIYSNILHQMRALLYYAQILMSMYVFHN